MRETHLEFIDRWAAFVRENPIEVWKPIHTKFINAQYAKAYEFYKRLERSEEGRKILARLRQKRSTSSQ